MFPDIRIKGSINTERVKTLKEDLQALKKSILDYTYRNFDPRKLNRIRVRIFQFPKKEKCNEYFISIRRKKYVCLNAALLRKRYFASLQYVLHGIAHSFCYLRDEIAQEAFCEWVSYSILKNFLLKRGEKFTQRILRSVMRVSSKEYNVYFRAARKLSKKDPERLLKLNLKAKNRKISKQKERRVFHKLLKYKKIEDCSDSSIPELEKGFKSVD